MTDSQQPVLQRIIRGCSRLLLWVGAAIFSSETRTFMRSSDVNFLVSAAVGILGGSLVMLLAAEIAVACKSAKPERHCETWSYPIQLGRLGYKS